RSAFQTFPSSMFRALYLPLPIPTSSRATAFSVALHSHRPPAAPLTFFAAPPTFFPSLPDAVHSNEYGIGRRTPAGYPGSSKATHLLPLRSRYLLQPRFDNISTKCPDLPADREKWPNLGCHSPYHHSTHGPVNFHPGSHG